MSQGFGLLPRASQNPQEVCLESFSKCTVGRKLGSPSILKVEDFAVYEAAQILLLPLRGDGLEGEDKRTVSILSVTPKNGTSDLS